MKKILLSISFLVILLALSVSNSVVQAQSCSGSVTCCSHREVVRYPRGCETRCDEEDDDCVRCTRTELECAATRVEACGFQMYYDSCEHGCNGTIESGSCSYTPPARPVSTYYPTPTPWTPVSTPTTGCSGSECETEPPPPPAQLYTCNPCTGACEASSGGSEGSACQASCTAYLAGSESCPPGPAPVLISVSSCPELVDFAVEDIILPGQTTTWTTWAPPPGGTPEERLQNESPGLIARRYTSPGDMVTIAYMFKVPEGEPYAYYLYDETIDTFYFYVNQDKPPVVVSETQEIVDIAVNELGYTLVDPNSMSASDARQIDKRVYLLQDDDDGDPWEGPNGHYPIVDHMPFGETYYHIPYVSCASLFRASGHSKYYTTNPSSARPGENPWNCFRRQLMPYRFPQDDPDDEYTEYIMSGNYLGMEIDFPVRSWVALSGESEGEQIWPRSNLYVGRDLYKYAPALKFSMMHSTVDGVNNEANKTPGFLRQAIMQIPVQFFLENTHYMHALVHIGNVNGGEEPIPNENSDQGCYISGNNPQEIIIEPTLFENTIQTAPPKCEDFKVINTETGEVVGSGGKVKVGETYTMSANVRAETRVLDFYNKSFNEPQPDPNPDNVIPNWRKNSDVTTFEVVDCQNNGGCIWFANDGKVLKVARTPESDQTQATIETELIETQRNVTNQSFNVEFWARVDGTSKVIPQVLLQRSGYYMTKPPYDEVGHPTDTRDLRFPNLATVHNIGDTTSSITVTNEWQKFSGTVTFTYDTTDPSGHPNGNTSSTIKLILKAPSGGANIYYDDISITSWEQPMTYFRMASALTPAQDSTYNQCSTTITQTGLTRGNLSGGYAEGDISIPLNATPGMHNFFAAMRVRENPSYTYFGNPNANANCPAANPENWNDDIASPPLSAAEACMRTVEVVACNETVPAAPTVQFIGTPNDELDNLPNASGQNKFNDIAVGPTPGTLTFYAYPGGNQAARDAVTAMTMYITPYNSTDPEILLAGEPNETGDAYTFSYEVTEDMTNEFTISVQAHNEDSCVPPGQISSAETVRHIRILSPRSGHLIEIPKEEYATYNCRDTRQSLIGKGQQDRIVDLFDPTYNFSSMELTVNTTHSFEEFIATYSPDYLDFKRLSFGAVSNNYVTHLPYNPLNTASWRNRITSYTLQLPENDTELSYVCLENCNPNVGSDVLPRCNAAPSATRPYMVIPKPSYPGYPHTGTSNDLNIYVGKGNFNDAWWQARGGLVFSNNAVRSNLPLFNGNPRILCNDQLSADICIPFIAARNLTTPGSGNTNSHVSSGFVITNSSSISNGSTTTPNSWRSQNPGTGGEPVSMSSAISSAVMTAEDFGYYFEQVDQANTNNLTNQLLPQLNATALNSATVYDAEDDLIIYRRSGSLEIDLQNNPITIPADKKVIIFVDGDSAAGDRVDIYYPNNADHTNRINVAEGGFFAIITDVNIVFDHTVGHSDHLNRTPAVEGIFMSDRNIIIETKGEDITDKKFIGEGSFIGLMGVDLQRKYDSDNPFDREKNSAAPVEQFIFSPSLVAATPNFLREADLTWQETN